MKFFATQTITLLPGAQYNYTGDGTQWRWCDIVRMAGNGLMIQFDQLASITAYRATRIDVAFSTFTLINTGTGNIQVNLVLGDNEVDYHREHDFSAAQNVIDAVDVSCGAGAQTQLNAGSAGNVGYYVSIATGAAGPVRIGGSTVAANRGVWLIPGSQPLFIPYGADIYVWNPQASAVAVAYSSVRN